jgi:predicted ABC-type ATPase
MNQASVARMRVFAGPNGSGKTTLMEQLAKSVNLYHIVSADRLLESLPLSKALDFTDHALTVKQEDFERYVVRCSYPVSIRNGLSLAVVRNDRLDLERVEINTYTVALIAAFLRDRLLHAQASFSFETVFSHSSKVAELEQATKKGYRVYLYFVATDSPAINCGRVQQRVKMGGHAVPREKISSRYEPAIRNLLPALKHVYRAYIFDNSRREPDLIAEVVPGSKNLVLRTSQVPIWFNNYVLQHLA